MTNDSKLGISFNNKMILPSNFLDVVSRDRILRHLDDSKPMIEIMSLAGKDSESQELGLDWEITSVDDKGFNFKLKYANPLQVSQNE